MPDILQNNLLTLLTFVPLIGAIVLMLLPRPTDLPEEHHSSDHDDHEPHGESNEPHNTPPQIADPKRQTVNIVALVFALLNFALALGMFFTFKHNEAGAATVAGNMQFVHDAPWITLGSIAIRYHMGVDGISMLLILLTTFLMVLCVRFSWDIKGRLKEFMVFLLLLETGMIGVFCALDLVLFYFFWEAMLIPMYFLIGIFGHENRIYAAVKFFIYTFAGSIFMLVAIVAVYQVAGSFDVLALSDRATPAGAALAQYNPRALMWMFGAFSLAFMIKVPMFPFHTWLPDAHVEAPTAGSVILAGVMLKMGTYGLLRFCLPMFPVQAQQSAWVFIILSITGIIYASIVAAVQPDAKKLVAYSSVAHLGFVVLGIFTFTRVGLMGALIQNINHGISTPMLFFIVGMMYERRHTRAISEFGGLKKVVPMMATMLLIATLSSIGVPLLNGFTGEFPVLLGTWASRTTYDMGGYWPAVLATTGIIWSAVYMLWWYQRLMLGPITKNVNRHLPDLTRKEWAVLLPLTGIIFWFGLGSPYWTKYMDAPVNTLLPNSDQARTMPSAHTVLSDQLRDDLPARAVVYPAEFRTLTPGATQNGRPEGSRNSEPGAGGTEQNPTPGAGEPRVNGANPTGADKGTAPAPNGNGTLAPGTSGNVTSPNTPVSPNAPATGTPSGATIPPQAVPGGTSRPTPTTGAPSNGGGTLRGPNGAAPTPGTASPGGNNSADPSGGATGSGATGNGTPAPATPANPGIGGATNGNR